MPYQMLLDVIEEAHISHELILQPVKTTFDRGIITNNYIKDIIK